MSEDVKNEYRCETCGFLDISGLNDSCPNEEICGANGCTIHPIVKSWIEIHGCASHLSFTNSTEHLNNLIKHFESIDDHEELYLCDIIELLKGKKKI